MLVSFFVTSLYGSIMEFSKARLVLFFIMAFLGGSVANVYEVGGSDGWSPNVRSWSSSGRIFQVGDVLVFSYDPNVDSVLQVNKDDYRLCLSLSPLATYKTGKDSITLSDPGEVYFISGNPGNCVAGEKLRIKVDNSGSSRDPYNPYNPSGATTRNASTSLSSSRGLTITVIGLILYLLLLPFLSPFISNGV